MRRSPTITVLIAGGLLLAACTGQEAQDDSPPIDPLECFLRGATTAEAEERPSPLRQTAFSVGGTEALLCYGAPSARERAIMGGLVVYGELERLGANEPTTLHLRGPMSVGDVSLLPGSYSIYAVPNADEWVFFINSNWERWGVPIDDSVRASEIGSFTAVPEVMDEFVETLRYRYEPDADEAMGDLLFEWENTRVRFHLHPGD